MSTNHHELVYRWKFIGSETGNLDKLIASMRSELEYLESLKDARIKYGASSVGDDYHLFSTTDKEMAEKLAFEKS